MNDQNSVEPTHRTLQLQALSAWDSLQIGKAPTRVDTIKGWDMDKSFVFRFVSAGPHGESIVAKHRPRDVGRLEHYIVTEIMPQVEISSLRGYGLVEEAGATSWLFEEEAVGESYQDSPKEHAQPVTEWVAGLHVGTKDKKLSSSLPSRRIGYHYSIVSEARKHCLQIAEHPIVQMSATQSQTVRDLYGVLRKLRIILDDIGTLWGEVEGYCEDSPHTLVHCDMHAGNFRIRRTEGQARVLVFDWGLAGWGLPCIDFSTLPEFDISTYASVISPAWPGVDEVALNRHRVIGRMFRDVAMTLWMFKEVLTFIKYVPDYSLLLQMYSEDAVDAWLRSAVDKLNRHEVDLTAFTQNSLQTM